MQLTNAQLKAIKSKAYTTADGRDFVFVDEAVAALAALDCSDPIECGHEAALGQAKAEAEQLRAELERRDEAVAEALVGRTLMTGLKAENGKAVLSMVPPRELALVWVECARGMLADAPNYSETPVEFEVGLAGEPERYALIVQRVGKMTPHEARQRAEAERDAALARLDEIRQRAHARSEELLNARDRLHISDERGHTFEFAASEVRQLIKPLTEGSTR
ncbi:hypothetical protein ACWEU6_36195 [Streptosporangium sandarakinum]